MNVALVVLTLYYLSFLVLPLVYERKIHVPAKLILIISEISINT